MHGGFVRYPCRIVTDEVTFLWRHSSLPFLAKHYREHLIYSCTLQSVCDYRKRRRIGTENNLKTSKIPKLAPRQLCVPQHHLNAASPFNWLFTFYSALFPLGVPVIESDLFSSVAYCVTNIHANTSNGNANSRYRLTTACNSPASEPVSGTGVAKKKKNTRKNSSTLCFICWFFKVRFFRNLCELPETDVLSPSSLVVLSFFFFSFFFCAPLPESRFHVAPFRCSFPQAGNIGDILKSNRIVSSI